MMNSGTIHPTPGVPVRVVDGVIVAELSGDLDLASAPDLREQLLGLLRPGASRLVLDLSRVAFCDASGLAVLVGASHRARVLGGFLRLAAVSPPTTRVLQLTGLHRHLSIYPTVHAATVAPSDGFGRPGALAAA
jgi:anti-sigma B factor antagonist